MEWVLRSFSNIAAKETRQELQWAQLRKRYRHHVHIALGSTAELMTDVEVGRRLGYWNDATAQDIDNELTRVTKLLYGIRRDINRQLALEGAKAVFFIACFWLATQ